MLRTYKYRLYPNNAQAVLLSKHFGCCRWIYNWALSKRLEAYQTSKKQITRYSLNSELPKLKKSPATTWLSEVNAQSLQQELVYLDYAYNRFFRTKCGLPKFKSKHGPRQSFGCPQHVTVRDSGITVPKVGTIAATISRQCVGKVKTVTISRTATSKYFASVLVDDGKELPSPMEYNVDTTVGIDVGLANSVSLSTGEKIANPRHLKQNLARLKREQRRLSRKKKGSNNRNKQRIKLALVHERVANARKDFLHKLSTRLVRENQALAFETLNIPRMLQNHRFARHIGDASWGMLIEFSRYKAQWYGKTFLQIKAFEQSSRTSQCGWVNHNLKLSDRIWSCPQCGRTYDRDIQAASNIKRWALCPNSTIGRDTPKVACGDRASA